MRTILITGATNGIGLETARLLAQQGHAVIIVSRSAEKVNSVVESITKSTGNNNVRGYHLDLGSLKNVDEFVKMFISKESVLHSLILNAGIILTKQETSPEGFELTLATNHLSHTLLLHKLLPLLKKSETQELKSRIVILGSGVHDPASGSGTPPPLTDLDQYANPNKYDGSVAYATSKLCNVAYALYLAKHIDISVAAFDPGFIGDTGLASFLGFFQPVFKFVVESMIAFNAWRLGVRNQNSTLERTCPFLAKLATDNMLIATTGKYYSIDECIAASKTADDPKYQEDLAIKTREWLASKRYSIEDK